MPIVRATTDEYPLQVSVVMACYNGAAFLHEAIESALSQTYRQFELIVVNDGSTDDSPRILAEYGDDIRVVTQENQGLPRARNAGISVSGGRYLAFLDADDFWHKEFLSEMVAALARSRAALAYCGWQNIGLPGGRGKPFIPPDYAMKPDMRELFFANVRWPVHAALVRADCVRAAGGFDVRWRACEDFAFWLEVAMFNRTVRVPRVLAFYRHHSEGQMTKNRMLVADSLWRIQKDFLKRHPRFAGEVGSSTVRAIMENELLRSAYSCYWNKDWDSARKLFRLAMRAGYGGWRDWCRMLPSLLPLVLHQYLHSVWTKKKPDKKERHSRIISGR